MSKPTRRARIAGVGALLTGLAVSAALVWQASYSAFTTTTSNAGNNWNAGQLTLNNDFGSAMFNVNNIKPGDTGTKCIVINSDSTVATTVKLYGSAYSQTKTVGDNLTLTVTQGTSTSTGGNCNGFAADSGASNTTTGSLTTFAGRTNFSGGFGTWAPGAGTGVKKTYQFTWTLNAAGTQTATDNMQGGNATIGFTWEAQSA